MSADTPARPSSDFSAGFPPADDAHWRRLVDKVLKGADFEKRLISRTADGLRIAPLFTAADRPATANSDQPGLAPFTRGFRAGWPIGGWDVRTLVVDSDPGAANTAILQDLEGGATSICLEMSSSGGTGLATEPEVLAAALDGVDLALAPIAFVAGEGTSAAADALEKLWDLRRVPADQRRAAFGCDPLGDLVRTGRLVSSLPEAMAAAAKLAARCAGMPAVTALTADGHPYHAAGASEAQELAAVLSTLVDHLRACEAAGLAPADALPKIQIGLASDADQLMTIAKLRAARRLVWRVAEACGTPDAAAHMRIASATAWRMLSKRDPWVNMLRATMACAAAAMGGADTIVVLPYTFPLGRPDAFARRIARNTQIVLLEEAGLGRVADPAGGSFAIERLTEDLALKAWATFQEWQAEGGMGQALRSGLVQDQIAATAETRAREVAIGRLRLTGTSAFPKLGADGVTVAHWPAPAKPTATARETVKPLKMRRLAEPFEALRDAADAYATANGGAPRVFLANLGVLSEFNTRATWIANLLAAGGIDAQSNEGFTASADAALAFANSRASVACLCADDATLAALGEATAMALKGAGAKHVLCAGRPGTTAAALKAAGVDTFLFAGMDEIAALSALHRALGMHAVA